jgi:hypothetical protein
VFVGLVALLALVVEDGSRRKRAFRRIDVAAATMSERTVRPVDGTHAAA